MDPRRLLILTTLGLLPGCAVLPNPLRPPTTEPMQTAFEVPMTTLVGLDDAGETSSSLPEPISAIGQDPSGALPAAPASQTELADRAQPTRISETGPGVAPSGTVGRDAIAAANASARAPSRQDAFVGGLQVFTWSPGRVFEIWTTPLRVTTLSLGPGETLTAKAAGDTVRWLIAETVSGSGEALRTHVLLKPLEQGLQTNLVLMTNKRVYLIDLKSGPADAFNAAVAWEPVPAPVADPHAEHAELKGDPFSGPVDPAITLQDQSLSQEVFDARYRIETRGRRVRWTPTAVFNDGQRTFIAFNADLQRDEAPALFVLAPDGEAQMVNYRQIGSLYIVDRVFDQAELRLGGRRPQVVRIRRLAGAAS